MSVGGWCSGDAISSVERYDPQTGEWRMVSKLRLCIRNIYISFMQYNVVCVDTHNIRIIFCFTPLYRLHLCPKDVVA
jgi:hypothetical protein